MQNKVNVQALIAIDKRYDSGDHLNENILDSMIVLRKKIMVPTEERRFNFT